MTDEMGINPSRAHATPLTDVVLKQQIASMTAEILRYIGNRGENLLDKYKFFDTDAKEDSIGSGIVIRDHELYSRRKQHECLKTYFEKARTPHTKALARLLADQDFSNGLLDAISTGYVKARDKGVYYDHVSINSYIKQSAASFLLDYSEKYPDRLVSALEIYKKEKGKIRPQKSRRIRTKTRTAARRTRLGGGSKKMPRAPQDVIEGRKSRVKFEVKDWLFRTRGLPKI